MTVSYINYWSKNQNWKYAIYPIIFISIFTFSGHGHSKKNTIDHVSKSSTTSTSIKKSESISSSLSKSENESKLKESESLSESQSKSSSEKKSIAESTSIAASISKSNQDIATSNSISASISKSNQKVATSKAAADAQAKSQQTTTTSQPEQSQQNQTIYGYTNSDGWAVAQSGWCFVSNSNIYYSRVKIPDNFKYTTIEQATSGGARIAKRGNEYAQP